MRTAKIIIRFTAIIALICGINITNSQGCCTVGNTFLGGLEHGGINYGLLTFSIGYEFSNLTRVYRETSEINDPILRGSDVQRMIFAVEYGLTDRMSIAVIPNALVVKNKEIKVKDSASSEITNKFSGSGFGDVTLFGKYRLTNRTLLSTFEADLGLGVKLPIGSFTKKENGTRLPLDIQPGNGAIELIGSMYAIKKFPKANIDLYSNLTYRYMGANFDGYKIGDEIFGSIFVSSPIFKNIVLSAGLRGRYSKQDFSEGRLLAGTGSKTLFLIPGIQYTERNLSLNVYYQHPVYVNVTGTQLTIGQIIIAEIRYSVSL